MIESITIKNVATFDPVNGVQITGLKKVNFIYGANGCGKTTIANYLQNPLDAKFKHCSAGWKNSQPINTLVYNKNFRERNFGKGKLEGVFTLGEATKEEKQVITDKIEQLKLMKADSERIKNSLAGQNQQKETLESDFKDYAWAKIYKKYQGIFKEAFAGSMKSGELFRNRLLLEFVNNKEELQTLDELKDKATTIFGEVPENITPISSISFERIVEIENESIWGKIMVGKADVDIAKLIQKLNINDWVNQGRSYIQSDGICPFCQQPTITEDFKSQLERFFDETYMDDLNSIKLLQQEYNRLIQNVINELNSIEATQKTFKESKLNIDKFSSFFKTLISQNTTNTEYLLNKLKEPSRSIELVSQKEQLALIYDLIKEANSEIKKHNDIVADFTNQRNNLINSIWKFLIEEFRTDIEKYNSTKNGLEAGIISIESQLHTKLRECKELDTEIKKLSKNVTSIQPTINEINRLLKNYGFHNFEIVPAQEEGYYQIQREDGSIAESTLSEGEITFITFLYYLQHVKGGTTEDNVNDERILVIDDPISSLDSNVLFIVSTLIKEILKDVKLDKGNIKQVILLTHNVYFHKEVSFIDGRTNNCNKTHYWILRKSDSITKIQPYLMSNPINSSYELLWQELRNENIKTSITIQNIMRRIIENYFKLLGKYGDDDLIQKFTTKEDQEICRSLISWINDGSHSLNDDLFVELQDSTIENYKKVFKEVFILTNHEGHYNMMMGITPTED